MSKVEARLERSIARGEKAVRAWYRRRLRSLVRCYRAEMRQRPDADPEELLSELVDSSSLVIYTSQSRRVLSASENAEAYLDSGEPDPDVSVRAYRAIEADMRNLIGL